MFRNVLIICAGNICRSPMAVAVFRRHLAGTGIRVTSAGLDALAGASMDIVAHQVMERRGFFINDHEARPVGVGMLRECDAILVMESAQRRVLSDRYPSVRAKTFRIGEWGSFDVPDPYGRSIDDYEIALDLIERGAAQWLPVLTGERTPSDRSLRDSDARS